MSETQQIIEKALAGVRKELANHRSGVGSVSTREQLSRFEVQLVAMLEDLRHAQFDADRGGMAHIVVDSWPLDHELGDLICAADQAYARAVRRGSA